MTSISSGTFKGCTSLSSVFIPNTVTSIESQSFEDCTSLASIAIPKSVERIDNEAFKGCTALTYVAIPNAVTTIHSGTFAKCTSLTSITIPKSVNYIDSGVFEGCVSLTSIVVEKENYEYDSRDNCNAIIRTSSNTLVAGCKSTIIPNTVLEIEQDAFCGCVSLTSITIPASVTNISYSVFGIAQVCLQYILKRQHHHILIFMEQMILINVHSMCHIKVSKNTKKRLAR